MPYAKATPVARCAVCGFDYPTSKLASISGALYCADEAPIIRASPLEVGEHFADLAARAT